MNGRQNNKLAHYFARRRLEKVFTQCRRIEGFLRHLRMSGHLNCRHTSFDFDEHRKAWQETAATVDDIKAFLEDHVFLRHNVITKRVECRIPEADPWNSVEFRTESVEFATATKDTTASSDPLGMAAANSKLYTLHSTLNWQPLSDRVVNSLWSALSREKRVRPL